MNHKDTKNTKGFVDAIFFVDFVSSWFKCLRFQPGAMRESAA